MTLLRAIGYSTAQIAAAPREELERALEGLAYYWYRHEWGIAALRADLYNFLKVKKQVYPPGTTPPPPDPTAWQPEDLLPPWARKPRPPEPPVQPLDYDRLALEGVLELLDMNLISPLAYESLRPLLPRIEKAVNRG